MYNYLPWPSNMRTADQVLSMRIQEGSAGYGVYVMLLELLRDADNRRLVFNPRHLAFAMNEPDVELVQRVVQAMATEQIPNGNITQLNTTNTTNPTKSKLLGMTWRDWDGERLFNLARKKEPLIDEMSRKVVEDRQKELEAKRGRDVHNLGAVLDVCDYFKVGVGMFAFLAQYTNYGRIGSPELMRLLALEKECRKTQFTPKYPAEYILVKMLEPLQGGPTFSAKGGVQE